MLQIEGVTSNSPWSDLAMPAITPSTREHFLKERFVRRGALDSSEVLADYDPCFLIVASSGFASGSIVGELHLEYDILLMKPVKLSAADQIISGSLTADPLVAWNTRAAGQGLFSAVPVFGGNLDFDRSTDADHLDTITFNRVGQYLCTLEVKGAGCTDTNTVMPHASSTATYSDLYLEPISISGVDFAIILVSVSNRGETLVLNWTGIDVGAPTLTNARLYISEFAWSTSSSVKIKKIRTKCYVPPVQSEGDVESDSENQTCLVSKQSHKLTECKSVCKKL